MDITDRVPRTAGIILAEGKVMPLDREVDPGLYDKKYFLTDNEGWREYESGLDDNIHSKFKKALEIAGDLKGKNILDAGCGRGELVYYCVKRGAKALGIDYSEAAIEIASRTIKRLPPEMQRFARTETGDLVRYDFKEKYDIIFMIEIVEHMYDWQLEESLKKIKAILKDGGKLIITTPNYYYERYLCPMKRIINIPLNLIKLPARIIKGKYAKEGPLFGLKKVFRILPDRGELNRKMHVNVSTPGKLENMLDAFDVTIICEDPSKNILSLLFGRWCGREIVAVAVLKTALYALR